MSKVKVPFIKPHLPTPLEVSADYSAIVASNWFTNFGPFETRFREAAANFIGSTVGVATVTNATLGIDLALRALIGGRNSGKKVIMPSFTFAAGAEAIISNSLTPVLIDIKKETWQPNIDEARNYIEENEKEVAGILLCNIFGVGNRDIAAWEALSSKYAIPLIIDTAAGFGSRYNNEEMTGSRGDCEIFSLHATKPFAVGEGGLVSSKSRPLIDGIRQLQNFGFGNDHQVIDIGTNAKMQEINAAIGLRQLSGFEDRLKARRETLRLYKSLLSDFTFQDNDELSTVPFASVVAPSVQTATLGYQRLIDEGIEARRYYQPLHTYDIIMGQALLASDLSETNDIADRIISLPVHDDMDTEIVKLISSTLNDCI